MKIYCCNCNKNIKAILLTGKDVYPHRPDLHYKTIYKCNTCNGTVGSHDKSKKPLGCIPSKEIKEARQHIHKLIDPLYLSKRIKRKDLYRKIAEKLNIKEYHTAEIRTIEEARSVYRACLSITKEVQGGMCSMSK